MKKILLFAVLFAAFSVNAQTVDKQTFVYAVKDADTLRLDRYMASVSSGTTLVSDVSSLFGSVQTSAKSGKPCLVFVFGGGFISGTRDNALYIPFFEYYARQGFAVVSIDYRLGLKTALSNGSLTNDQAFAGALIGTLAMATEDLYDATAYVLANAKAWDINPGLIVASGSSAGAITVLMGEYGICNGSALTQHLPQNFNYAGVISFAGAIFDMSDGLKWAQTPAPMMLFHGDADRNVPYNAATSGPAGFFGSKYIADGLTAKRIPHWVYSVTNTDHSVAVSPMTDNRYEIDAFLAKMVLGRQPLVIDTYVTPLDAPDVPKSFTLMDYIRSNFGN